MAAELALGHGGGVRRQILEGGEPRDRPGSACLGAGRLLAGSRRPADLDPANAAPTGPARLVHCRPVGAEEGRERAEVRRCEPAQEDIARNGVGAVDLDHAQAVLFHEDVVGRGAHLVCELGRVPQRSVQRAGRPQEFANARCHVVPEALLAGPSADVPLAAHSRRRRRQGQCVLELTPPTRLHDPREQVWASKPGQLGSAPLAQRPLDVTHCHRGDHVGQPAIVHVSVVDADSYALDQIVGQLAQKSARDRCRMSERVRVAQQAGVTEPRAC
jgi:hypothetical protein